jgi:hypothetical protein
MMRLLILLALANPLSAAPDLKEGLRLLEDGKHAAARRAFRAIPAEDCPLCGLYLGIAHFRGGNFGEARKALDAELAKGAEGPAPALALGYAYLIQAKRHEEAWMAQCLGLSSSAKDAPDEERLFMAQALLDAISRPVYADDLRLKGAEQVLAEAAHQGGTPGGQNMAGRAWILKAEVAKRRKELDAEAEAMDRALAAFQAEMQRSPRAVYAQNAGIAARLRAEIQDRRLWTLPKLGPSEPQAVAIAQAAQAGFRESVALLERAVQLADQPELGPRLDKLLQLSRKRVRDFEANASVQKVLGLP